MWTVRQFELRELSPGGYCLTAAEIKKKVRRVALILPNRLHCYIGKRNVFESEEIYEILRETGLPVTFSAGKGVLTEDELFHLVNFVDGLHRNEESSRAAKAFYWQWRNDLLTGKRRKYNAADLEELAPAITLQEMLQDKVERALPDKPGAEIRPPVQAAAPVPNEYEIAAQREETRLITDVFAAGKAAKRRRKNLPERLLICGWYGTETLGDKAILGGVIGVARALRPNLQVDIASLEPYVSRMTQRQMPELGLDRILTTQEAMEAVRAGAYGVVAVGGGPLMSPIPWCTYLLELFSAAHRAGSRTVVAGCGVGPLFVEHRNAAIKHLLELADEVVLRDQDSADRSLKALGVERPCHAGLDPAFIWIQKHMATAPERNPDQILLAVRDWPIHEFAADMDRAEAERVKARYEAELIKMIRELRRLRPSVRIVPFCMHKYTEGGDDRAFYRRLLKDFPEEYSRIDNQHRAPVEDLQTIARSRAVLAMRFHSTVFSLATRTPFLALDYTRGGKIQGVLRDMGASDLLTSIDNFDGSQMAKRLLAVEFPDVPLEQKVAAAEALLSQAFQRAFEGPVAPGILKIGILDQTSPGWSGGTSYTRAMLSSIALNRDDHKTPSQDNQEEWLFLSRGKIQASASFQEVPFASFKDESGEALPDVVIPVRDQVVWEVPMTKVGWIPDFQHCRLPGFFTADDLAARDALFEAIGRGCHLVIVSSEDARRDFQDFLPNYAEKARIARFASMLWDEELHPHPDEIRDKYMLPERFALVVNQFWKHKNHSLLPAALAEAKRQGVVVPLALTGLPLDYRDPENGVISTFFQECARLGVRDQIHFLGYLPYKEMVSLMRCSVVLIQPSHFEGWNTSIEDAKALGRPVLCSDLAVHKEQLPDGLGFFSGQAPEQLAALLVSHYPSLPAGPHLEKETECLAAARERSKIFGGILLDAAREAATM